MSISGIETNTAANVLSLNNSTKTQSIKANGSNEISDIYSESNEATTFKEIVGKYDITNISRNEINEMSKELHDNGLISLKEMMFLTFDPTQIPGWQDGDTSINGWKMSSDPDKKMNFLEGFKTQAEWNKKHGDSQSQSNLDMMFDLAEKIKYFQA